MLSTERAEEVASGAADTTTTNALTWRMKDMQPGEVAPPTTPHGTSFHMPTWALAMTSVDDLPRKRPVTFGYPRFFIHKFFDKLNEVVASELNDPECPSCYVFPSVSVAEECVAFVKHRVPEAELTQHTIKVVGYPLPEAALNLGVVQFSAGFLDAVHGFMVYSGQFTSTRLVQRALNLRVPNYSTDFDVTKFRARQPEAKGEATTAAAFHHTVPSCYPNLARGRANDPAIKQILRARIASYPAHRHATADDVYLFPSGMSAIHHARRIASTVSGPEKKCAIFGFTYVDTREQLKKFGAGCHYFGNGDQNDLVQLEQLLAGGERIAFLHCEIPSNPMLRTVDLIQIKRLSVTYDFPIVVDATLGSLLNLSGLDIADVVVASLSKIFSGFSDVMGGSLVLTPTSRYYSGLRRALDAIYAADLLYWEDAVVLEFNSRNLPERVHQINRDGELLADYLHNHPMIKAVHYPKYTTPENYHQFKATTGELGSSGGYGGVMSFELRNSNLTIPFYEALNIIKGPSVGTNFTMVLPYSGVVHRDELDEVAKFGLNLNQLRISMGLEGFDRIKQTFDLAFAEAESAAQ